jgi:hypothetical protein
MRRMIAVMTVAVFSTVLIASGTVSAAEPTHPVVAQNECKSSIPLDAPEPDADSRVSCSWKSCSSTIYKVYRSILECLGHDEGDDEPALGGNPPGGGLGGGTLGLGLGPDTEDDGWDEKLL